jgi:hypothetical protein
MYRVFCIKTGAKDPPHAFPSHPPTFSLFLKKKREKWWEEIEEDVDVD